MWFEERSTKEILEAVLPPGSGRDRYSGTSERASRFSPVVYTCGVSVSQELRGTKAVLGGLQGVESTQNDGSEKAGVGGSTPSLATMYPSLGGFALSSYCSIIRDCRF